MPLRLAIKVSGTSEPPFPTHRNGQTAGTPQIAPDRRGALSDLVPAIRQTDCSTVTPPSWKENALSSSVGQELGR
jgi:hypothetical protein